MANFENPFKPGAGHAPPYLAGREEEKKEFSRLLEQKTILENIVLTGLRGVGKTVLLETFKPIAMQSGWLWVGTDLSESASITEDNISTRLLADLSIITSGIVISTDKSQEAGFNTQTEEVQNKLNYQALIEAYQSTPGLAVDKLKHVLLLAWNAIQQASKGTIKGIIFAYDEAQNLADHQSKEQFPLSLMLDCFQSLQKQSLPLMLVLTGLPTLFPKLVESRTYSERMFRILLLKSLSVHESREAVMKPISTTKCPVRLSKESVDTIITMSGGYPYFIQFICREVYDAFLIKIDKNETASVPVLEIEHKLDSDFFAGRWAKATDRQRELMTVISQLDNCDDEFTVQEISERSKQVLEKGFSNSHVNQMLNAIITQGLAFKNRYGKYSFAVPLLGRFIRREMDVAE